MSEHAQSHDEPDLLAEVEQIRAQMSVNRSDIDDLLDTSEQSAARADSIEGRAEDDRKRIDGLESRADLDHELLLELQAAGLLRDELTAQLQLALRTSRRIGAAIGIVMLARKVSEEAAFGLLRTASQNTNQKLRLVADEIVQTGDVTVLPAEPTEPAEPTGAESAEAV